ncbi:hypothetical protein [Sulfurimonas sp.]|uniref:hypothetical protein n=1 Tax=Sulfurimonas sp. TaxID=2022749 RepID=UPI0025D3EC39|nr:hypothetical protein [Sulfurimonas sp.]
MNKKIIYFALITITLTFGGCTTSPKVKTKWVNKSTKNYERRNNPIEFRFKPVIGTKQSDTKVMIDMGEWAKIWVKNYKNKNKTFVATHSIVTMIREPGFIAGEQIPRSRRDTVSKSYGARSFSFRSQDLTYNNSSLGSDNISDSQIKDYMNSYEYSKKTKRMKPQKKESILKYDKAIKEYMKKAKVDENNNAKIVKKESVEKEINISYGSEDENINGGLK